MSLNGLDNVEVTQAYQAALAEAGGWFLLQYISRDAVQVLTRGTGGAGEARAAVAQYDEKSPLYGLLLYRRRKVLVKYVPEGTSRLLQARVAVHFINVTEKFAPHDIVLTISTPDELSDAALTAVCSLHTAAPSSSSSSGSSRQQKLSWIQEAAEEGTQPGGEENPALHPVTEASDIPTIHEPPRASEDDTLRSGSVASQAESVPLILEEKAVEHKLSPQISHTTMETVSEAPVTPEDDLSDLQATLKSYDTLFEGGPEPRNSSQTARPNYNELYEHYYAQYTKPKVKLGPRPRPSLDGRRPSTSASAPDAARPVSSLPSGLRSATRKAAEKKESKTKSSSAVPNIAIPPPPPVPTTSEMPHSPLSPTYSSRAPASVKSMPVSSYSSHHRSTGMTQEKTRLMKALELRKKQQAQRQKKEEEETAEDAGDEAEALNKDAEAGAEVTDQASPEETELDPVTATDSEESTPTAQDEEEPSTDKETSDGEDFSSSLTPGLVVASSQMETDDLNSTASVSSPISAQTQGSSGAPSTRPSSISEDESSMVDTKKPDEMQGLQSPDLVDEEQSVNSTPTVVPESSTPVPPVEANSQSPEAPTITERAPSFDDADSSWRETLKPTADDSQSNRRSNRESTIYMPTETFQQNDGQGKRRNRESMLMPSSSSRGQSWYELKEKRRAIPDPLQINAEDSEVEYLSDDSFMEELQSATVHEAKPMSVSVSKSPITPFFPRKSSTTDLSTSTPPRSSSSQYQGISRLSPSQLPRKSSGGWPPQAKTETVAPKKISVSSGISQRIKALAEKTNRESGLPVTPASAALNASSSSLTQRKSSFFATTPSDTSPNERTVARLGSPSFLGSSVSSTPDKIQKKKQPAPVKATVYNVQKEVEKPESVQVTARIVRDERTARPSLTMPTEGTPLDLHQSPLIIDHQKSTFSPKSPTRGRSEPASPRAPSSSHSREQSIAPSRTSSESTWRNFGRRMSESKSVHSHDGDEKKEDKKDKKESRTSKMFKRMSSSMSSMPWKNSSSSLGLPESDMRSTSLASVCEPPPPVHVGDLNIQLPDTLLWKRRWVEIDNIGNLVLSPSKHNQKGIVKRFHLSDFRTPYPPDQDRQEMPYSVVLDFLDGRTLQCACETYAAQAQVLQILREAHDAWRAYEQAL